MREHNGELRGLLRKSDQTSNTKKNRVVFDETRNEFFEADYIILIREECIYDDDDEESCTCGDHELVRLCCEEECPCNPKNENKNLQNPNYPPPVEFVEDAALSPPDGYKDNSLKYVTANLGTHVFGIQHIQQLQVIQKLQQQRASMLATRGCPQQKQCVTTSEHPKNEEIEVPVCTECADCAECGVKAIQNEEPQTVWHGEAVQPVIPHMTIVSVGKSSPDRRKTQKEIVAGEERPKNFLPTQEAEVPVERHAVREPSEECAAVPSGSIPLISKYENSEKSNESNKSNCDPGQINGILKWGKLWKNDDPVCPVTRNIVIEQDASLKRSVHFLTENVSTETEENVTATTKPSENQAPPSKESQEPETELTEIVPFKKASNLLNNTSRPNSAVRQLFPSATQMPVPLTHETLKAFDESKKEIFISNILAANGSDTELRRTFQRSALRRSLTSFRKKSARLDTSLEERIKQLTCDFNENNDESFLEINEGFRNLTIFQLEECENMLQEENAHIKNVAEKNLSPSSSLSSSSNDSSLIYKKSTDLCNRDKKQGKTPDGEENAIIIFPQECKCPAAPDIGMGVQAPATHTQIHQTPSRQIESKKPFLSTLAPLASCVAGQKDDLPYYTLASDQRNWSESTECLEYNIGNISAEFFNDISGKIAPDVIAGTLRQGQDGEIAFIQEVPKSEEIKKKHNKETNVPATSSQISPDDDEQNDYGFNKRPSVRGIEYKFETANAILKQMQENLNNPFIQHSGKSCSILVNKTNKTQKINDWSYCEGDPYKTEFNRQTYGHKTLTYQNWENFSIEHFRGYARSPAKRPESPPPLKAHHHTMVLIPYNNDGFIHLTNDNKKSANQIHMQNIIECQNVSKYN